MARGPGRPAGIERAALQRSCGRCSSDRECDTRQSAEPVDLRAAGRSGLRRAAYGPRVAASRRVVGAGKLAGRRRCTKDNLPSRRTSPRRDHHHGHAEDHVLVLGPLVPAGTGDVVGGDVAAGFAPQDGADQEPLRVGEIEGHALVLPTIAIPPSPNRNTRPHRVRDLSGAGFGEVVPPSPSSLPIVQMHACSMPGSWLSGLVIT